VLVNHYRNLFLIITALLISVMLNQDRIVRSFYNDTHKHAVPIASSRTYLGDDYHYYVAANDSLKLGIVSKDKVYSTNNVLLGSLATSGLINLLCHNLFDSSDIAVLISLILQTFLLVLATMYTLKVIGQYKEFDSQLWLGICTFVTLVFSEYFLINSFLNGFHSRPLLSYYPNILRMVNPQIGWAYGLAYFSILFTFLEHRSSFRFIILCVLSLFFSIFSPSLCLTWLLAMSIFLVWDFLKSKSINYVYLSFGVLLLISFVFNFMQLHNFQASPKGLEIGTGVVKGIVFEPHYFIFLILIFPLSLYYKDKHFAILTSVLLSSVIIGAFCQSMHLGDRLWIRGAGIYVWIMIVVLISHWVKSKVHNKAVLSTLFLSLCAWTFFLLPHQFKNDYGYIQQDKWVLLDWINRNVPSGSVIMSDDLEFSFLLPIYTSSKPFVPLFSYSNLTAEQTAKRYFRALDVFGTKDKIHKELETFNINKRAENTRLVTLGIQLDDQSFNASSFFEQLIYYPFTKFSEHTFDSEEKRIKLFKLLRKWSDVLCMDDVIFDYLIVDRKRLSNSIIDNKPIFETDKYLLVAVGDNEVGHLCKFTN